MAFHLTSFKLILKQPNRVGILRTSRHSPRQPLLNPKPMTGRVSASLQLPS
jgi:hypothetical protein